MPTLEQLAAEMKDLRTRVEAAEAVQAIQNLKARYAQLVDERYVRGKVAPDERVAAVAEQIAARMRAPTLVFSWHFFLKPQIHVDGERARARWDILSPCTTKDGRPHWMVGFEDDEYARVDGAWLHTRMKLTSVFLAPHDTGWQKIFY
jgi:SnoaL-like domain